MGSDWNERANIRRDFRGGKTDIDEDVTPPRGGKKKRKKKKNIVVEYRYTGTKEWAKNYFDRSGWVTWGKYAKEEDALKAIEAQRTKPFWGTEFEFRLKGKKGNV